MFALTLKPGFMKNLILAIDDAKITQLLLTNVLTNMGYEVVVKENVDDALDWLEEFLPHLIICDIQMANKNKNEKESKDGYYFLTRLRQRGYTKHTPVIMLSGVEEGKERVKCYQLGAQDFLAKPFNIDELDQLIKKNLNPIHYARLW